MNPNRIAVGQRVVLLAQNLEDAASKSAILEKVGIVAVACDSLCELGEKVAEGCEVIVVAAESLNSGELSSLADLLRSQETWSDIPIIVIAGDSAQSDAGIHEFKTTLPNSNVMFLHRPLAPVSFASAVQFALRERQRHYALRQHAELIELTHDAIIVRKENGEIIFWNRSAEELYGWSRGEVTGKISHDLLQTKHSIPLRQLEAAIKRTGEWNGELRHMNRTGREIIVESRHLLVRREGGSAVVLETNRDITERQRAEQALRDSEKRLRLALEATSVGTWDFNPITGELTWDECSKALFGLPPDAHVDDATFLAGLHPEDRAAVNAAAQRALEPGSDGHFNFEYRVIGLRNGAEHWVSAKGRAAFDSEGRAVRFIGTMRDITQRKRVELELERARREAEQANKAKDQFLAALSHELRTPLTPVLMAVSAILREPELAAPLRDDLDMIRRNIELEARLIDDLLDLTRIARGKLELQREAVNMHVLIVQTVQICTGDLEHEKAPVNMHLHAGDFHVFGDPTRLQQVFWNLLNNALKFTPPTGRIDVTTRSPANDRLAIEIADTGIGIDPGKLDHLFDAFEQGGRDITRRYGGLGLGLAISKALVEAHEGTLHGRSDGPDKGATFTFELNTIAPPLGGEPTDVTVAAGVGAKPLRILVIEDHEHTLHALTRLLTRAKHRVEAAASISAARVVASEHEFDLIISDLGLPDGSGLDLLRELRATYGTVPAIALSGYGMEEDVRASEEAGFAEHVTKPVDWKRLEGAIMRAVAEERPITPV